MCHHQNISSERGNILQFFRSLLVSDTACCLHRVDNNCKVIKVSREVFTASSLLTTVCSCLAEEQSPILHCSTDRISSERKTCKTCKSTSTNRPHEHKRQTQCSQPDVVLPFLSTGQLCSALTDLQQPLNSE